MGNWIYLTIVRSRGRNGAMWLAHITRYAINIGHNTSYPIIWTLSIEIKERLINKPWVRVNNNDLKGISDQGNCSSRRHHLEFCQKKNVLLKGLTQNLNLRTHLKLEHNIKSLNYIQKNFRFQDWFLLYWTMSFILWHYQWFRRY